jgi:simple sugar transport system substrate-binding protein
MTIKRRRLMTLALSSVLSSSSLVAGVAVAGTSDPLHILFVNFSNSSDPFQAVITRGAEDAAKQQGVQLDLKFAEGDLVNQNNILETGIANKVDGIITSVPNDDAFNAVLCKASNAGIPVILMNIDHSKGKAGGTCRLAFVGQNFVAAGYAIGKRMIDQFHLKKGDLVFTPVEFPEAVYAVQRHEGVQKALDEVGAKSEMLGVGTDGGQALTLITQYLVGHPARAGYRL